MNKPNETIPLAALDRVIGGNSPGIPNMLLGSEQRALYAQGGPSAVSRANAARWLFRR